MSANLSVQICTSCNVINPPEALSCTKCGGHSLSALATSSASATKACNACQTTNAVQSQACSTCGGNDFAIIRDETSTNSAGGSQVPLGMTKCQQCGQLYELRSSSGCPMCSGGIRNAGKESNSPLGLEQMSQQLVHTNKLLQKLIEEQRETRKALRWSLAGLGFILVLAYNVFGVKVHGVVTILGG